MKLINNILMIFLSLLLGTILSLIMYVLYSKLQSLLYALLIMFYFFNLAFSLFLITENRNAGTKISWMTIFLILPIIGQFSYFLFGQKYKYRKSHKEYIKDENFKYEIFDNLDIKNSDIKTLFKKQSMISNRGVYKSKITLFDDGALAFDDMFKKIKKAKKNIYIQYYIIKPGELFEELSSILIKKANEGVEVKILIDDFGRWALPWHQISFLKQFNIDVAIFGEVKFPFIGSYNSYRLHRKTVIIDNEICYTGGVNIADEYIHINKKYGYWVDQNYVIYGKGIRTNLLTFIKLWNENHENKILYDDLNIKTTKISNSNIISIEDSPENSEMIIEKTIVNMILSAKKTIKLTTPYLVPSNQIFNALKSASLSGVKIDIYLPGLADKKSVLSATKFYADILMNFNINIYISNDIFVHTKLGLFDNKYAYFGSINLDRRTLYSQWETICIVEGEIIKSIKNSFEKNKVLYSLKTNKLVKGSFIRRFFIKLFINIFSPIM